VRTLQAMLAFVRNGDTVVVHSMDRLARNLDDLRRLMRELTVDTGTIAYSTVAYSTVAYSPRRPCSSCAGRSGDPATGAASAPFGCAFECSLDTADAGPRTRGCR
jgi:predicted PhzF superfamily epimerase YddE/YHI9